MSEIIHITQEERARLREQADKSYLLPLDEDEVPSVGFDGLTDDRIAYIAAACNSVPRLLNALEAAEAENARLRKMTNWLALVLSATTPTKTSCEATLRNLQRGVASGLLPSNYTTYWKQVARRAMEEEKENE